MLKGLWGYVLFFALSLGAAYWASLGGGERDELAKEWVSIDAKDLTAVTFKEPGIDVALEAKPYGYWVTVTEEVKKAGEQAPETKTESFKASEDIKELEGALAPLVAQRVVGEADKLDLKEFGFDAEGKEWTVSTKAGKVYKYRLGNRSYGSRNVFLLDEDKKQVIMISGAPLELLRNARTRLYERDIIRVDNDKLNKLAITFGETKARWVLGDKDSVGVRQWKDDKEGAAAQASYRTWLEKILKSKVQRFASAEEQAALASTQPFLTVALLGDQGELGKVTFKKRDEVVGDKTQPAVWVESSYLGDGVVVQINQNRALPIEKDIDAILKTRS